MRKPTIDTLAAELGVSRQTVSNVLNNPAKVAPQTRSRVLEAIQKTGYRPSAAARALRTQQTYNLGMRLRNAGDGINGAVMDGFLHALTGIAGGRGYRIVLFTAADDDAEIETVREFRDSHAVDGVILADTHVGDERPDAIVDLGLPVVAFGRPWGRESRHSWVDVDGRAGVMEATAHLFGMGHRLVGFIGWPSTSGVGQDRQAGWIEATGFGPGEQERYSAHREDSLDSGMDAMAALHAEGVTAVVCASDSLALGAARYLDSHQLAGDVIGFDDTPVARMVGLSSLRQPVEAVARHVTDFLIDSIGDPARPAQQILLPPRLQWRTAGSPF